MAFSKQAFSMEERNKLKERIKELEKEVEDLKNNQVKSESKPNKLDDMLC
jgi:hypothetical protein